MFAAMKQKLMGNANKISGKTDVLEAICAAAALVAAADGDISDAEITTTIKAIESNAALKAAFTQTEIHRAAEAELKKAEGGRVGKMGLKKEIRDVADKSDHDTKELVLLAALDVADHGGIDDKERVVLEEIAKLLGLKLSDYV